MVPCNDVAMDGRRGCNKTCMFRRLKSQLPVTFLKRFNDDLIDVTSWM
jgi:hypothetical protein